MTYRPTMSGGAQSVSPVGDAVTVAASCRPFAADVGEIEVIYQSRDSQ